MKKILAIVLVVVTACFCNAQDPNTPALHLNLTSPLDYQVVQRSALTGGKLIVAGSILPDSNTGLLPDKVEVMVTGKSASGDLPAKWQPLPCDSHGAFRGELNLPAGGWYRLEVRAFRQGTQVGSAVVEHVGIGEIFIIAGQSNSANYGEEKHTTQTGLVAAYDGTRWQPAADPMSGAGGKKGSFMPLFGDAMAERFHVPIGIVAMGIGSTSVREWMPNGTLLSRLPPLTRNVITNADGKWEVSGHIFENFTARMKSLGPNGFRAVLWHQGESDARQADPERTLPGDLYRQDLEQLIRGSRQVIGWNAPWFVAQVSYHNPSDTSSADIRDAQKSVCDDGLAILGPDTDTLTGDMREKNGKGIHLSAKGLKAHADLWVQKVGPWLEQQIGGTEK